MTGRSSGNDAHDDAYWQALDTEWFGLPDPEVSREGYLRLHPGEFVIGTVT